MKIRLITTDEILRQKDRIFDGIAWGLLHKSDGDSIPVTMNDLGL